MMDPATRLSERPPTDCSAPAPLSPAAASGAHLAMWAAKACAAVRWQQLN